MMARTSTGEIPAAIALAAAQECRTWSVRQSSRVFKKWARKEAEKKAEKDMPVITGV